MQYKTGTSYMTIETAFLQLVPGKHKIMNGKVDCLNCSCAPASQYTLVQPSFILFWTVPKTQKKNTTSSIQMTSRSNTQTKKKNAYLAWIKGYVLFFFG